MSVDAKKTYSWYFNIGPVGVDAKFNFCYS